jgi:hypothetical protein
MSRLASKLALASMALGVVFATALSGCSTEAFCFDRCGDEPPTSGSGSGTGGSGGLFNTGGGGEGGIILTTSSSGTGGGCMFTGAEICDGIDNDCDGTIDNSPDIDFTSPTKCGTCENNCFKVALYCEIADVQCAPSPNPGTEPGVCSCSKCIQDYYDIDGDGLACEYYCIKTAADDSQCDNKDNDCDGIKDENVDVCADEANCGKCNNNCVVLHGTAACVNNGTMPCNEGNTQCQIQQCDCNGPNDCWKDLDGSYVTGCEYKCAETNNGVEICGDGIDNDCDGLIDGTDDLSGDPQIGVACYGDPDGECATAPHAGMTVCQANNVTCSGMNLRFENQVLETCNNKDDDCDGAIDDSPTDQGSSCGQSNVAPCAFGVTQCQGGALVCTGAVNPQPELCNGQDDDCDTMIDDATTDSGAACGQTDTGPCQLGSIQCNGGVLSCFGAVDPLPEACDGIDNDCDGTIDDGATGTGVSCGTSNVAPCALGTIQCSGGMLTCVGAINPQQETCDAIDNDCNGQIDDNATGTNVSCGTSNTAPCQFGTILCQAGSLTCVGAVNPQNETCNGTDDDCDGAIDDSPGGTGAQCGQTDTGPCQFGSIQCQAGSLACVGAVNPQSETCNGVDDDCDGTIDDSAGGTGGTCGQTDTGPCQLGTIQCQNGAFACVGAINPVAETCDGIDNDCNGVVDNSASGTGVSCGTSNTFPCAFGTIQCQGGSLVCNGAINPTSEVCDGVDNDCDGSIDDAPGGTGASCGSTDTGACQLGSIQCQGGTLTCIGAVGPQTETCNNVDDDCDGSVDEGASGTGATCGQTSTGPCQLGTIQCQGGALTCVGEIGPGAETCNNLDDDCDGAIDDNPTDAGGSCGVSNVFPCSFGSQQCQSGALVCVGAVSPQTETCNGVDDNCDGTIDKTGMNPPLDATGPCNVPPPPPAGATSPCTAGAKACVGGGVVCLGSTGPTGPNDSCGVDANCDGALTNQPNLQTDVNNCGACGNNCYGGAVHSIWSCAAGMCQFQGCENGYYDLNGDLTCEYACTYVSAQEACNGADDDCDGQVDEGVIAPSPTQICGVSPSATTTECKSQSQGGLVAVTCQAGTWQCTFPPNVCSPSCAGAAEVCDGLDNDCDGVVNENTVNFGKPCASDDGIPPPGHGACRTTGTFVCSGPNATTCSAIKASCATLPGGCDEKCDNVDNDCDGTVDERYTAKGTNTSFFIKPTVTKVAASTWIYTYEASRPNATLGAPGSGNGYHTAAPAGETLDKTLACSDPNKIPWFNVTPIEVEQACSAMGGKVCERRTDWTPACQATQSCTWGYNPRGAACTSTFTASKYCNLGPSFDFDAVAAGDQDGLLPTASALLQNCSSDWSNLQGNTAAQAKLFDTTGNLREITRCQRDRAVCGNSATACQNICCSGTSTSVDGGATRLCGAATGERRLSGQVCQSNADCCNLDSSCTVNGSCKADAAGVNYCTNLPAPALSCRAKGNACTNTNQCCGGEQCLGNICGGPGTLPHPLYPLMGGSFSSADPNGATCTFDFFTTASDFKLFDAGFRCCFSQDPTL